MRLGDSETDYYNLGGAGVAGTADSKAAATPQDASGAEAAAVQETIGKPANEPSGGGEQ